MYKGANRVGTIVNPFKKSRNAVPAVHSKDDKLYHWDDLMTDEYFEKVKEEYTPSKHDHQLKVPLDFNPNEPIVWIDIETTGLDITKDKILEISCVITDSELNLISTDRE